MPADMTGEVSVRLVSCRRKVQLKPLKHIHYVVGVTYHYSSTVKIEHDSDSVYIVLVMA